jgi:hypothetical protein
MKVLVPDISMVCVSCSVGWHAAGVYDTQKRKFVPDDSLCPCCNKWCYAAGDQKEGLFSRMGFRFLNGVDVEALRLIGAKPKEA